MVNYKDFLKRFVVFIKENKIVLLFGLVTTLSGFLIIGNIYSNYEYFLNHKYFISLSKTFSDIFTIIKSFFYNNIIQGSSESLTSIFNLKVLYGSSGISNITDKDVFFNYIVLLSSIVVFLLVSFSSYIITFINTKKDSIKNSLKELKPKLLRLFALDSIRVLVFSLVFIVIALISVIFRLNSYLFIIISFTLSFITLYILYFIYQFALRNILFLDYGFKKALSESIKTLGINKKNILLNSLLFILILIIFLFISMIIFLPISLLNSYFINIGYSIFNTVGTIFYIIINLIITTLVNIGIIRFINDIYFENKK